MIPGAGNAISVAGGVAWLAAIAVAAFVVAFLATDVGRVSRAVYAPILALVTAGLTAGYLAWSGTDVEEFLTTNWIQGLVAAGVTGGFLGVAVRRQPSTLQRRGRSLVAALGWEGGLYGAAEGLLLSALPALVTWQFLQAAGWDDGGAGGFAAAVAALGAGTLVVVTHHLGYKGFRGRQLALPSIGCGVLTVGYLLTGSVLAPVVGHILLHTFSILHGFEMPPFEGSATMTMPGKPAAGKHVQEVSG